MREHKAYVWQPKMRHDRLKIVAGGAQAVQPDDAGGDGAGRRDLDTGEVVHGGGITRVAPWRPAALERGLLHAAPARFNTTPKGRRGANPILQVAEW